MDYFKGIHSDSFKNPYSLLHIEPCEKNMHLAIEDKQYGVVKSIEYARFMFII